MTVLVAIGLVAALAASAAAVLPAARRTGLGPWHPGFAWLALEGLFFGIGSAILALDDRPGPALYLAGAALAFSLGVAVSDRLARWRVPPRRVEPGTERRDDAAVRWPVVVALAGFGIVLLVPTLLRSGLPFFAGDITGARGEIAGLTVQVLRVAIPALALGLVLWAAGRPLTSRRVLGAGAVVAALVAFDVLLASRYLAAELIAIVLVGLGLAGVRIPLRAVVGIALVAVVAFGGIQVIRAYDQAAGRELAFAVQRTVNRVVLIQPRTIEALQAAIPDEQPYFLGQTWARRAGPVLGRPDIPNLGYWVYARMFPSQSERGYAAPGILGEAWANFGPAGLLLLALLGVFAERLGALVARRGPGDGDLIAGALAIVFVARTHAVGVNGLAVLLVLVLAWRLLAAGGWRTALRDIRATVSWST